MDPYYIKLITIVSAVFFGVFLLTVGRYLRVPAIVPLLIGGVLLGPEFFGLINTAVLGNDGMKLIISLCVAIILFEGGLTLDPEGFKKAPHVIWRLLTIGVLITWFGSGLLIHYLFDYPINFSMLAASLIIVTGPTVIAPLLQRINVKDKLHNILHWEGVLIDPIGVFIAILCFEWYNAGDSPLAHFEQFSFRILIGIIFGLIGGKLMQWMLARKWIHEEYENIFTLAGAIALFGISDIIMHEAGILTVVVAGLILGLSKSPQLKRIKEFKLELTELAIAFLFILLAANLKIQNFIDLGWTGVFVLLGIMLLVRPLVVLASTIRSELTINERVFLSWIAPRGIVAGSMASLFTLELTHKGVVNASFLEAFTFSVIGATIFIQGLSAKPLAKLLKVTAREKNDWLIVGAHLFARRIARFIQVETDAVCVLVDTNKDAVDEARKENLAVFQGSALELKTIPEEFRRRIGYVLALTDNRELNKVICIRWAEIVKKDHLYRWTGDDEVPDAFSQELGQPVWQKLPKPSQVAYNLRNKEANLIYRKANLLTPEQLAYLTPLIANTTNGLQLTEIEIEKLEDGYLLGYYQLVQHLPLFLQKKHILTLEKVDSFEELLRKAVKVAHESYPLIDVDETVQHLMAREDEIPTALSNGVVMPHTRLKNIAQPICLLVRLKEGIDLHSHDHLKSRLFFILLNPENDPETHLLMLADVAKIASDPEVVESILEAATTDEVLTQLKSLENLSTGSSRKVQTQLN
jgi:NhaP-type Na+/H+ or K+/H+ antiporter/mannitol/fructose-specific phosphotransferase system IIA component (Ntr-type)